MRVSRVFALIGLAALGACARLPPPADQIGAVVPAAYVADPYCEAYPFLYGYGLYPGGRCGPNPWYFGYGGFLFIDVLRFHRHHQLHRIILAGGGPNISLHGIGNIGSMGGGHR